MNINFQPLTKDDVNYSKVIELYGEAFPGLQRVPSWLLRYKLRKGKKGFNVLYAQDTWIGLIQTTEYKDIIFIQFFAITELSRSSGYGSMVVDSMKNIYSRKRIVLNIEELDEQAENQKQRIKRKAFYLKNRFKSSGYIVKEPAERLEMLILGGSINKEEIEAMYKELFGSFLSFFLRPKVIKI